LALRAQRSPPLRELLEGIFDRYRRPLCVTETSHVGEGRAAWLRDVSEQVGLAIDRGVPVIGVCLYPVIDRCDWDDASHWHNSGLWDLREEPGGGLTRVLNRDYAEELLRAQRQTLQRQLAVPDHICGRAPDARTVRPFEQEHDDAEQRSVCR
jgi:UDP-galactopyranose mutase